MTTSNCMPTCIFGEVLFDIFPDGKRVLGGAPFNVAWHLQAFGQGPHLVSAVGDDEEGRRIRASMTEWGMTDSGLGTDLEHPTGRVRIQLESGEPSYEIVPHCAYDYVTLGAHGDLPCSLLYHGSLATRNDVSARSLDRLKAKAPERIFVDVNLRPPWWSREKVMAHVADADWVKLNRDELHLLDGVHPTLEEQAHRFKTANGLAGLILTLGAEGAIALGSEDELIRVAPPRALRVVDAVGAGDAFSSVLILGIGNGWPLNVTMERAQEFASQLVQRRGATVSEKGFYQPFIQTWGLPV